LTGTSGNKSNLNQIGFDVLTIIILMKEHRMNNFLFLIATMLSSAIFFSNSYGDKKSITKRGYLMKLKIPM